MERTMTCGLCGEYRGAAELQTIESIFEEEETLGQDTLTVCIEVCADKVRAHATQILRDEPFLPKED